MSFPRANASCRSPCPFRGMRFGTWILTRGVHQPAWRRFSPHRGGWEARGMMSMLRAFEIHFSQIDVIWAVASIFPFIPSFTCRRSGIVFATVDLILRTAVWVSGCLHRVLTGERTVRMKGRETVSIAALDTGTTMTSTYKENQVWDILEGWSTDRNQEERWTIKTRSISDFWIMESCEESEVLFKTPTHI